MRFRQFEAVLFLATVLPLAGSGCGDSLPGQGIDAGQTVVYRDDWGVPHIYAPTAEAGLYAMGYAQAQDRPEQLLKNFLLALGEFASIAGEDAIEFDLRSRRWDHYGTARRHSETIDSNVRRHIRAFVDGMNDFYSQHPNDNPSWWKNRKIDPYMVVAWSRFFLYNWSIDEAYEDLGPLTILWSF
ncbi:MAG: penicillin acylase family protein [Acidobacteriota bacterium]